MLKEFFKLTASYALINIIQKIIDYLSIILFITVFSTEEYGIISLNTTIILTLTTIMSLSLEGAIVRYYYNYKNNGELKYFMGSVLTYLLLLLLLMLLIFIFFTKPVWEFFLKGLPFSPYIILAIAISALDPINRIYIAYLQVKRDIKGYALFYNSYIFIKLLFLISMTVFFKSVELYFIAYLIGIVIFVLISLYKMNQFIQWNFRINFFIVAISYSIYVVPVSLISIVNSFVDRYFILNKMNLSDVGVYSAGVSIGQIVYLIASVINIAYVTFFIQKYEEEKNTFIASILPLSDLMFFILLSVAFLVSIFSPMLQIFLPITYTKALEIIPLFAFVGIANGLYFFYTNFLSLEKKLMKYKFFGLLIGFLINIPACYFLVTKIGITGAAIGTLLSMYLSAIILKIISSKVGKYEISNKYLIVSTIFFFISMGLLYVLKVTNIWLFLFLDFIFILFIYYYFDNFFFSKRRYLSTNIIYLLNYGKNYHHK